VEAQAQEQRHEREVARLEEDRRALAQRAGGADGGAAGSPARAAAEAEAGRLRVVEEYASYKRQISRHLAELSERQGEAQRAMRTELAARQADCDELRAQLAEAKRLSVLSGASAASATSAAGGAWDKGVPDAADAAATLRAAEARAEAAEARAEAAERALGDGGAGGVAALAARETAARREAAVWEAEREEMRLTLKAPPAPRPSPRWRGRGACVNFRIGISRD